MDFKSFILEEISHQVGAETTQIKTTTGTYTKCAMFLLDKLTEGSIVLDYGAGHGLGSKAMQDVFGDKSVVESYETSPQGWTPNYSRSEQIRKQYDGIVCLNVLNVLTPDIRETVVSHILSLVKEGGYVIIGTRGWYGDIANAKNVEPSEEDKAVWVLKSVGKVYQKGFDGSELLDYINSFGSEITFKKLGGITKSAVIGHKL